MLLQDIDPVMAAFASRMNGEITSQQARCLQAGQVAVGDGEQADDGGCRPDVVRGGAS